jgi:arylsulfatase A
MVFLEKSKSWLEQHVKRQPQKPFFLYHAMQAVHLPSFAAPQFKGKTQAGPHGDFIAEMDSIVGELVATLKQLGVADNTLILFSSDNGPETTSVVHMRADQAHDPARPWRGVKRDSWEGGHRVPLIAQWPGHIKSGVSDVPVCLTDVLATCAEIIDVKLPINAGEDSFSFLPALTNLPPSTPQRDILLHQTINLSMSIRRGEWKYLDHRGSGGNDYEKGELQAFALPEMTEKGSALALVISQVHLYGDHPHPGELMEWFDHQGFKRLDDHGAYLHADAGWIMLDTHIGNFIRTLTGTILPIDVNVLRVSASFRALFGLK